MRRRLFCAVAAATCVLGSQAHALSIVPYFDSSITSAANAAAIEASINAASQFYSAFTNPVTVNIAFTLGRGLGGSSTSLYGDFYSDFVTNGLAATSLLHPENAPLASGVANLAFGNQADLILAPSADFRALGDAAAVGAVNFDGGTFDGVVTLNASIMNFTNTLNPNLYPANPVIQHEIDEILGVGGAGSLVDKPFGSNIQGFTYMGVEDLYRFSGAHTASFTTNSGASSYFSVDGGATNIMGFNQGPNGDFGDWTTDCGHQQVQDWEGCPGTASFGLTFNSPEVTALQAIGYNLTTAVPEPSEWALLIAGFGLMGAVARRRRGGAIA